MLINNQFYIFTYAGSIPLDLMTEPAQVSADPILKAQYSKFIKSIDTIYGSQSINGDIPVFWTIKSISTDLLGNNVTTFTPSTKSTLTQLDSKESYYVIVRDPDSIPITVPMLGDAVVGFSNNSLAPSITGLNNVYLGNASGNSIILKPEISKLQLYETYYYEYQGLSANWPVTISPLSGYIKASDQKITLNSLLTFCATSGACCSCITNDEIIPGVIANTCPTNNEKNLYSALELQITPSSFSGIPVKSNTFIAQCDDCLPRVKISLSGLSTTENNPVINLSANTSTVDVQAHIENLEPTQSYSYEFVGLGANWPAMFITPINGTIKPYTSNYTLVSKIVFCPTTGLCPSSDSSVIDYTVDPKFLESFYTSFVLKLTPSTCIEPFYPLQNSNDVYSNSLTIYCNDCL